MMKSKANITFYTFVLVQGVILYGNIKVFRNIGLIGLI